VERLSPSDLGRTLSFVREIAAVDQLSEFPVRVLDGLKRLIPCDLIGYNEINPSESRAVMVLDPPSLNRSGMEGQKAFERLAGQHPVLQYHARTGDGRALKISDFLSRDQFHRLDLYGLAFNRSRRSFSERDRRVLDLVRPHLVYAHRNAELRSQLSEMVALLERLLEAGNRAVVLIDQSRRIRQSSGRAAALLVAYLGSEISPGDFLPPTIDAWVKWCGRLEGLEHGHAQSQPLVIYGEHGRLVIRFLPRGEIGAYDALLLEQVASADQVRRLKRLSVRENEVLGWVARGKTNPQIARILSVSAGTVQKHLEHIYDKLGVRTRAAAAVALAGYSALDEI